MKKLFLHLGGEKAVSIKNIIAIMDMETSSVSNITKEYLKEAEMAGDIINISFEDLPKSYVICNENNQRKVYISPISSATLLKRANSAEIFK